MPRIPALAALTALTALAALAALAVVTPSCASHPPQARLDCRHDTSACADGFTCAEAAGGWSCVRPEPVLVVSDQARLNLRRLYDASVAYYKADQVDRAGAILPRSFPDSVGRTPAEPFACSDGLPVPLAPRAADWEAATWDRLGFSPRDPLFFRYEYVSEGTAAGARFTARALGDLNCDGVLSTYEISGEIDANFNVTEQTRVLNSDE